MNEEERIFIIKKIDKEISDNKKDAIFYGSFSAIALVAAVGGLYVLSGESNAVAHIFATGALSGSLFVSIFNGTINSIRKITDLKKEKMVEEMSTEIEEILEEEKGKVR